MKRLFHLASLALLLTTATSRAADLSGATLELRGGHVNAGGRVDLAPASGAFEAGGTLGPGQPLGRTEGSSHALDAGFWPVIGTSFAETGPLAPVARADFYSASLAEAADFRFDPLDNDLDENCPGGRVCYRSGFAIVVWPAFGELSWGQDWSWDVSYAAPGIEEGTVDSFVYEICDPDGLCDQAEVTIHLPEPGVTLSLFAGALLLVGLGRRRRSGGCSPGRS
jgi:hypothetical protein